MSAKYLLLGRSECISDWSGNVVLLVLGYPTDLIWTIGNYTHPQNTPNYCQTSWYIEIIVKAVTILINQIILKLGIMHFCEKLRIENTNTNNWGGYPSDVSKIIKIVEDKWWKL